MKSRWSQIGRRRSVRSMHLEGLEPRNLMAGLPDYAALYIDAPETLDSGQALVRIPWSVQNVGQGDGGRFISLDIDLVNVSTGQSLALGHTTMPDLTAGRTHSAAETSTIPSGLTSGYYDFVLRIDRENSHAESNETNNQTSDRVWINGTTPPTPPTPTSPDARESNDTLATATNVLPIQSLPMLSIHSSTDVDYFRFAIAPGWAATGTITMNINGGDLDMALYDHAGNRLQASTGVTSQESISVTQLPSLGLGNYYYLKVYGYSGATGGYSLNLNLNTTASPGNTGGLVRDSVGLLDPVADNWYLSNRHDWRTGDLTTFTTPVVPTWWIPITGDWNGDGTDTVGLYDQYSNTWYLNNSPTGSLSSLIVIRTPAVPYWWVPITGDWNGDGRDSIGLYDPYGSRWYLNNRIDGSISDLITVQTPAVPSSWRPITGDWDGNGTDTIGLLDPVSSRWYLNNRLDGSTSSLVIFQTPANVTTGTPITGDWNNDGRDTVGVYDAAARTFRLNNRADGSVSDMITVKVPDSVPISWKPLAGNWDGVASSSNAAATTSAATSATGEGESDDLRSAAIEDVNRDGVVSPADVLCLLNALNARSSDSQPRIPATKETSDDLGADLDVDGDGVLRPRDALLVINAILAQDHDADLVIARHDEDDLLDFLAADAAYASQVETSSPVLI